MRRFKLGKLSVLSFFFPEHQKRGELTFALFFAARVPSLSELESGVTAPATDEPRPPVPATEQPLPPSSELNTCLNLQTFVSKNPDTY